MELSKFFTIEIKHKDNPLRHSCDLKLEKNNFKTIENINHNNYYYSMNTKKVVG